MAKKKRIPVYKLIDLLETSIVGIPAYADAKRSKVVELVKSLKHTEVDSMATEEQLEKALDALAQVRKEEEIQPAAEEETKEEEASVESDGEEEAPISNDDVVESDESEDEAKEANSVVELQKTLVEQNAKIEALTKALSEFKESNQVLDSLNKQIEEIQPKHKGLVEAKKMVSEEINELPAFNRKTMDAGEYLKMLAEWSAVNQKDFWTVKKRE